MHLCVLPHHCGIRFISSCVVCACSRAHTAARCERAKQRRDAISRIFLKAPRTAHIPQPVYHALCLCLYLNSPGQQSWGKSAGANRLLSSLQAPPSHTSPTVNPRRKHPSRSPRSRSTLPPPHSTPPYNDPRKNARKPPSVLSKDACRPVSV